jgi:hypothetical protein
VGVVVATLVALGTHWTTKVATTNKIASVQFCGRISGAPDDSSTFSLQTLDVAFDLGQRDKPLVEEVVDDVDDILAGGLGLGGQLMADLLEDKTSEVGQISEVLSLNLAPATLAPGCRPRSPS